MNRSQLQTIFKYGILISVKTHTILILHQKEEKLNKIVRLFKEYLICELISVDLKILNNYFNYVHKTSN